MANLMKKFKRKRRLSSELHSRWGDPAISYPNQGSWNQRHQPPGFAASASIVPSQNPYLDETRRYVSVDSPPSLQGGANGSSPQHMDVQPNSNRGDSVIPKGYFDENIRHRAGKSRNQSPSPYHPNYNHNQSHTQDRQPSTSMQGLGIDGTRYTHERAISNNNSSSSSSSSNHNHDHHDAASDSSCGEDDEGRDTLGDPGEGRGIGSRTYATGDASRLPFDDYETYPDRACKSPPLSVTSRMRRVSTQSSATEHSSLAPPSSRRTSYTAASSVSAPSLPPDTPRYAVHAHVEKRAAPRARYRVEPGPPTASPRQEMVPSYDELYG